MARGNGVAPPSKNFLVGSVQISGVVVKGSGGSNLAILELTVTS